MRNNNEFTCKIILAQELDLLNEILFKVKYFKKHFILIQLNDTLA